MTVSSAERRVDWLALAALPRLGGVRWRALLDHLDSPLQLLTSPSPPSGLPEAALEALLAWRSGATQHPFCLQMDARWQAVQRLGLDLVCWDDPDYPETLRHIPDPPLLLYLRGDRQTLNRTQLAMVGSRHATREGLDNARRFAGALASQGLCITSGLALGVDAAAHVGALEAGGWTLAVLAGGLDQVYPSQHRRLADQIAAQGALISEIPPGVQPRAGHFPRRNRLISGLSRGVLVVEASVQSGSLITARCALEQGREVFAIPGSIHNPAARGCHRLIREGAKLVETVDDVLEELSADALRHLPVIDLRPATLPISTVCAANLSPPSGLSEDERCVWDALQPQTASTDELSLSTGLPADRLLGALLMLEMQGHARSVPGGYCRAG